MNTPLLIGGLAIVGISLYVRKAKAKNILDPETEVDTFPEVYLSPPAGYRRAKQTEVTPAISAAASASLSFELGTMRGPFTNEAGVSYYVGVETHKNETKGKHKGASIYIAA